MALATYLMSREQYEDRCRERLESLSPDDPERVTRALLHRYPATSEQAAAELQTRGLDAAAEALPPLPTTLTCLRRRWTAPTDSRTRRSGVAPAV